MGLLDNSYMLLVSDSHFDESIARMIEAVAEERELRVVCDHAEALHRVELDKPDIVFCQLGTGALASALFLNEVWKRNPKSARFLIDTSADHATLVRCVLAGHQYLQAPLDGPAVKTALVRAESIKQFVRNDRIQSLVSRMRTLPSKPSLYLDILKEVRSPAPNPATVGAMVEKDLGVASKLIQLVNSPFYALSQPISDLKDAIVFLGLDTTASIVMSLEALSRFDKLKPLYFSADRVWKHSQLVAEIAKKVCKILRLDPEMTGHAYLAALVHDIGKLAFAENFDQEYHKAVKISDDQNRPLFEVENDLFGVTHAETGAYLLAVWGLPLTIVEAVAQHHSSPGAFGSGLSAAAALHVAEHLVKSHDPIDQIITRYPPELGLRDHIDKFEMIAPPNPRRAKSAPKGPSPLPEMDPSRDLPAPEPLSPERAEGGRFSKLFGGVSRFFDQAGKS